VTWELIFVGSGLLSSFGGHFIRWSSSLFPIWLDAEPEQIERPSSPGFVRLRRVVTTPNRHLVRMVNRVIYGVISGWHEIAERIVYNVCIDFSMARNVFPLNCLPKIALLVPVYTE